MFRVDSLNCPQDVGRVLHRVRCKVPLLECLPAEGRSQRPSPHFSEERARGRGAQRRFHDNFIARKRVEYTALRPGQAELESWLSTTPACIRGACGLLSAAHATCPATYGLTCTLSGVVLLECTVHAEKETFLLFQPSPVQPSSALVALHSGQARRAARGGVSLTRRQGLSVAVRAGP